MSRKTSKAPESIAPAPAPETLRTNPPTDPGRWVRCEPCGRSFIVPTTQAQGTCPTCGWTEPKRG